jgi:ABC-2 type transport system permease protein
MSVSALARKELRQLSRDPRLIAVLVLLPALLLLFFGYVLSFDVKYIRLAIVDHDHSAASRSLVATLTSNEYFTEALALEDDARIPSVLLRGEASIVVIIPPDYSRRFSEGSRPIVQAIIDGSNATVAQTAQGYVEGFVESAGATFVTSSQEGTPPLSSRLSVLYNPELASERFLLPGLVAFILMIAATVATALSVVKERETGTIEQLLVSPLSPGEVMLGKAIPYAVVSLTAAAIIMVTARLAFGLRIQGSLLLLAGVLLLFVVSAQGLGLLISSVTTSQQVAFQTAAFATMLPALLLSGFVFPIRSMPVVVQAITYVVPARYFVTALRGIVLKGVGAAVLWKELAALVAFATVTLLVATLRLRKVRL